MVEQIFIVLIIQLFYFIFFYKSGISLSKYIGRRVCPTCFSVSMTWATTILLKVFNIINFDTSIIAVLLAESVVGVSHLSEEFLLIHKLNWNEGVFRFGTILYGTFSVLVFIAVSPVVGFILFFPVIVLGYVSLTPVEVKMPENSISRILSEKLKKCCG